ncbi:transmembrane reductase CYB561D2-like [Arctopsyche grandis]|uniref:transmembrane reductase CYB561D2-like n=1 Tax=Arctopsyche grandis TaxID=121162 RepID=UPI00406D696B
MEVETYNVQNDLKVRLSYVLNTLVHMAAAIVIYIVWKFAIVNDSIDKKLQLHIIFSVTGYQFLIIEAILSFAPSNSWSFIMHHKHRKVVHLILQVLGAIFVIVGFSLAVAAKSPKLHFRSGHGICGLIGFIFTLICLVNGTLTFLAPKLRDKIRPTTIKFGHAVCGCIAVSMGLITLCIAINTSWFINSNGKGVSGIATALVVLSLAFTLLYPAKSIQGFLANMRTTEL